MQNLRSYLVNYKEAIKFEKMRGKKCVKKLQFINRLIKKPVKYNV